VSWVEREGDVRLHWEEQGEGPAVLIAPSYLQYPELLQGVVDQLAPDHRVGRYDARGTGQSTRSGPYDMDTDVADFIAVAEAAAPLAAVLVNGDATNRAVHAAARRPELIPVVVSMESVPLSPGDAADSDALISSGGVLSALVAMMRADFRSGMTATIQRGNPDMTNEQVRERVDRTVAYASHDASLTRLEEWIADQPGEDAHALGDRLVIAFEGAGAWFTAELVEQGQDFLPEARFERLEGGALSRPELTAAVVRGVTAAARR
jgi:pimeloyl-ACP methyl ester carboxylesterase